jgi:hypothetical protein
VDLVLGPGPAGDSDAAIEINPRLTTSYVGLRALATGNLGSALLAVCDGRTLDPLAWKPGRIVFRPDGTVAAAESDRPGIPGVSAGFRLPSPDGRQYISDVCGDGPAD